MESHFRHDFGQVRIHTDAQSADSAAAEHARAYTVGQDIVFGAGEYDPGSPEGRRLLAHELAHTVQQKGGATGASRLGAGGAESAARLAGLSFVMGSQPNIAQGSVPAGTVQREDIVPTADKIEMADTATNALPFAEKAIKIKNLAAKLASVAAQIKAKGKGMVFSDKDKLAAASLLVDVGNKVVALASAFEAVPSQFAGKTDQLSNAFKAADLIANLLDDKALKEMEASPNDYSKAKAWANQTADVFKKAGDLIPDKIAGMNTVWLSYFKLLFSAPAIFINAFSTILEKRYETIDKETGLTGTKYRQSAVEGEKRVWEGELSGTFIGAQFADADSPQKLQDFMRSHREIGGLDLYALKKDVGKALLISEIEKQGNLDQKAKDRWLKYLNKA